MDVFFHNSYIFLGISESIILSQHRIIERMVLVLLTLLVSWVSIIKLCTCFSALVSSSFFATTATTSAVHPAPWDNKTIVELNRLL